MKSIEAMLSESVEKEDSMWFKLALAGPTASLFTISVFMEITTRLESADKRYHCD